MTVLVTSETQGTDQQQQLNSWLNCFVVEIGISAFCLYRLLLREFFAERIQIMDGQSATSGSYC